MLFFCNEKIIEYKASIYKFSSILKKGKEQKSMGTVIVLYLDYRNDEFGIFAGRTDKENVTFQKFQRDFRIHHEMSNKIRKLLIFNLRYSKLM